MKENEQIEIKGVLVLLHLESDLQFIIQVIFRSYFSSKNGKASQYCVHFLKEAAVIFTMYTKHMKLLSKTLAI